MLEPALVPVATLLWLQVKHMVCDFFLQTSYQIHNKGRYGHPAGLLHAGIHMIGSVPIFLFYPVAPLAAVGILAAEFVAHYHIDWIKNQIGQRFGWTPRDQKYWWAMGADQFAHQLTYLAMAVALIGLSG